MLTSYVPSLVAGLIVVAACALAPQTGFAQTPITFQYSYDETGQLIRAVDSTGVVIEYVYDAVGNMLEVRRSNVNPTQLTILGFSPSRGGRGTLVTIEGIAFSSNAADNIVSFNGVQAPVSSATANTVVAQVPAGASTGPVNVTVGSITAISPNPFTVIASPFITSTTPRAFDATRPPTSIQVTGSNLTGSDFALLPAFAPPSVVLGAPQIDRSGTVVTLPLTVASSARGTFVLVATNTFGSSDAFPNAGNTLVVVNAQDDVDSDGDGFPDGLELLFGSDPALGSSVPQLTSQGTVLSPAVAVVNKLLTLATLRNVESEVDRDGDGFPEGLELLYGSNPFETTSVPILTSQGTVLSAAVAVVNKLMTLATPRNVESEVDRDGDGFTEGLELLYGSNPFEATSVPDLTSKGTVLSAAFSVRNTLASATSPGPVGPAVSVLSSTQLALTTAQQMLGLPQGAATNPAIADLSMLEVRLDQPADGERLIEGQTITIQASVNQDISQIDFVVNDVSVGNDSTFPYQLTFTVPSGVGSLTFAASASDAAGTKVSANPVAASVDPDPFTTVSGRVVDAAGLPVSGAIVELLSEGLRAEFFDFQTPLSALPDVTGRVPDRLTRVTAINQRNPNRVFGPDPFGAGLALDYAARFTGWISIGGAGVHRFILGTDEGARLKVGGVTVVDIPAGTGGYHEDSATISLNPGLIPIEVSFYASAGVGELQLSFVPPEGERQVVSPTRLIPDSRPFVARTDESGRFVLTAVPTALDSVQVRATASQNGQTTSAPSVLVTPVSSNGVNVGDIVIAIQRQQQ